MGIPANCLRDIYFRGKACLVIAAFCVPALTVAPARVAAQAIVPNHAAPAERLALTRAVPADSLAVFFNRTAVAADGSAHSSNTIGAWDATTMLIDAARRIGALGMGSAKSNIIANAVASLPLLRDIPWAITLLDLQMALKPEGDTEMASISLAIVLYTQGRNAAVEARIQDLLGTYSDSSVGRIVRRSHAAGDSFQILDSRLPFWAEVRWGPVGPFYVIALGPAAFDRVVDAITDRSKSLFDDAWFANAYAKCQGDRASVFWTIHAERFKPTWKDLPNSVPQRVLEAWGLSNAARGVFTITDDDRVAEVYGVLLRDGRDEFLPICRPASQARSSAALVPDAATRCAFFDVTPKWAIETARDGYLAGRSPVTRRKLIDGWERIEAELGVSFKRDVLEQLGPRLIVHDWPVHPLGLPLARTILIEITGSADSAKTCLDALMQRWSDHLASKAGGLLAFAVQQTDDGIWYMRFGINGPALAVTDRWIVISYSPHAVQQNVVLLTQGDPGLAAGNER